MRHGIVVVGFFVIVLMVIAGCTSPQSGAPSGSNNRNSAIKETTAPYSPEGCHSLDPVLYKKFLPDIPGWHVWRNLSNYDKVSRSNIFYAYRISENREIKLTFGDVGSCTALDDAINTKSKLKVDYPGIDASKINNFHGYPAVKVNGVLNNAHFTNVYIAMNDRLYVIIESVSVGYSLSDAREADIETFANAIDFNGFAALV